MSFDQSLITSQQDNDLFAPSWLAGKALAKTFKPHDIEAVNVVKTCDKLRSALMQKSVQQLGDGDRSTEDNEKQCGIRETHIPFRTCSNLWYGTLKIYQQQVDTLFRLSQDLVLRSSMYDIKSLEASKRKSSSTSNNMIKKRRLTISETNENTFVSSNYSELLDDLERLTQDTAEINIEESTNFASTSKSRRTRPLAQIQIREITIREINATTYGMSDFDDNDDNGFGEATQQEISQFFNFFEENSKQQNKKTPTKRKTVYENQPPAKHRYNHDSTIEPGRNENISIANGFLGTPHSFRCPSLERSISPTNSIETTIFPVNKTFTGTTYESSSILVPQNCNENENHENTAGDNNDIPLTEIKEEMQDDDDHGNETNHDALWSKKKNTKLIIDKCIKIEQCEIIEQMERSTDFNLTKVKKIICKKLKNKRSVTALELLTRFNRRAIKLTVCLKQKITLKPDQFQRDYLNLLCDILKTDYNEEWASEIYPKWQQFETPSKQRQSKRLTKTPSNIEQCAIFDMLDENLNIIAPADDANNNNPIDFLNGQVKHKDCNEQINYIPSNEWRPYGVMMKLLDIWRYSTKNEIDAVEFCNSAKNQTDKALAFYSLLNLYKNQYISLTKRPQTIVIDKILLGKTTEHLINANNSRG